MKKYRIVRDSTYENLPINTNGSGCHGEILDAIRKRIDYWFASGTRVQIIRLDIRFPVGCPPTNNNIVNDFLCGLRLALGNERLHYVWVAERESSLNQHFHFVIFRDGQTHRSGGGVWEAASKIWGKLLGCSGAGLVNVDSPRISGAYCNCGVVIDKNSPNFFQNYQEVFYWLSYLAKQRSKTTETGHSYGVSQLYGGLR